MTYQPTTVTWVAWEYTDPTWADTDLTGFKIEALDGEIGKVDHATQEMGKSSLIADVGSFLIARKVMLPAGIVSRVDPDDRRIYVNRTKEQIKNAPEFDDSLLADSAYWDQIGTYYSQGAPGWRDPVYQ
jgi:hypothetical protein